MLAFKNWLYTEPTGFWNCVKYVLTMMVLVFVTSTGMAIFYAHFGLLEQLPEKLSDAVDLPIGLIAFMLAIDVFFEEVVFRFLPLYITRRVTSKLPNILTVAVISSIVFGLAHGSVFNIPIQGIAGLIFSFYYLKMGGLRRAIMKPLLFTTIGHFFFDFMIFLLASIGTSASG